MISASDTILPALDRLDSHKFQLVPVEDWEELGEIVTSGRCVEMVREFEDAKMREEYLSFHLMHQVPLPRVSICHSDRYG